MSVPHDEGPAPLCVAGTTVPGGDSPVKLVPLYRQDAPGAPRESGRQGGSGHSAPRARGFMRSRIGSLLGSRHERLVLALRDPAWAPSSSRHCNTSPAAASCSASVLAASCIHQSRVSWDECLGHRRERRARRHRSSRDSGSAAAARAAGSAVSCTRATKRQLETRHEQRRPPGQDPFRLLERRPAPERARRSESSIGQGQNGAATRSVGRAASAHGCSTRRSRAR